MKLTVIGAGYVGLVTAATFAELGYKVIVVEKDKRKIEKLTASKVPFYEPEMDKFVSDLLCKGTLKFTNQLASAVIKSDIVFIAVGTPSLPNGQADLSAVIDVAQQIGRSIDDYKVIVVKSTVPVGTNDKVKQIIKSSQVEPVDFGVVANPEFLREGSALYDSRNPERIVVGTDNNKAAKIIGELYEPFDSPILFTDPKSAEMIKYASNAFLATKISFINEISNICEKVGADVTQVAKGMGFDKRIGPDFLKAGIGYGGSCFPKDTRALIQIAGNAKYDFKLLKAVVDVNNDQCQGIIEKLKRKYGRNLSGKKVGVWGLAFKPETDDLREAPSIKIINTLLELGAQVSAYDPKAKITDKKMLTKVKICENPYAVAEKVDALVLVTEWEEFKNIELDKVYSTMRYPLFIDGRNVFDPAKMIEIGFDYYSMGRPPYDQENLINYEKLLAERSL